MVNLQKHGNVLEIQLDNPPVNALGVDVRQALSNAIDEAQSNPAITAIVIRGAGRLFCAGADITEFDGGPSDPQLPDVVRRIELSIKPVVAAIHGVALGGGLEVALGCHYRIAARGSKLGLPEVKLGILPGAGGTQRLPRLVGVDQAASMILSGEPISASKAAEIGLVDKVVEEDALAAEAITYACTLETPRPTGDLSVSAGADIFDRLLAEHSRRTRGLDAPEACIEALKAATELSIDEGQRKESALFERLVGGQQSMAMRHAFFAERAASKIKDLPRDVARRSVARVGVIGAGTMGGGISMNFLSAGIPVTIVEMVRAALDRGVSTIRGNYGASAARGRITAEQVDKAMGLLTPTLDFDALADCDLVIEAVYEDMETKKDIFARLDGVAKPGALLASNTSYLSIDEIASVTARPQDVLGLHFFSPAHIMKLVEVVRGAKTAPDVLATAMELARTIGKVPVVSGVCYGFIGNRMLTPRLDAAIAMLVEGATPEQVDRVSVAFGMPMGPLQMIDLAGVDIGWHRDPSRIESIRDALNAAGRWGQKVGGGFYDYDEKRRPSPSPTTQAIIHAFRVQANIEPRDISDEEIMVRTIHVMVNEAAKILEEGIAQRASDIDVVWLDGYGWPRHRGGPMFWADQEGLTSIVAGLRRYAGRMVPGFTLSPLLERCAASGLPLDR